MILRVGLPRFRNLVLDQPLEESDLPPRIAMAAFEETRVKNDKKVGFLETRFYVSADLIAPSIDLESRKILIRS